ncbi:MAG: hypothetical protein L0Y44_06040 [Phycisphaerales bacterium]|nr:hypothetical protein [Phycisphaerales bacterium]MCI0630200.1 hypothetical protein [Phycisphaerales bacterium]MCI0677202.1 hypothetical protein [Phycisphaerales bacterium]
MAPTVTAPASAVKPLNVHTRATFVRAGVKEIPLTTKTIDAVMPYFPKECKCISGYLDNSDQYWKVNYHWDLLVSKIDEFLALKDIPQNLKNAAQAIKTVLLRNAPTPRTGYKNDKSVGFTKDSSAPEKVVARHGTLKQSKKDFQSVIVKAKVVTESTKNNPPVKEKHWWLAVAPLAAPGTSKHGSGYALDIAGNNNETTRISKGLGASLVFNEASHVHVEWKNGVKTPA